MILKSPEEIIVDLQKPLLAELRMTLPHIRSRQQMIKIKELMIKIANELKKIKKT